jgi:hypothetical protein
VRAVAEKVWHQPLTPLHAFGVLRVLVGTPQTGAQFRRALRQHGHESADCELWAKLFDTFANERHTPATERLLRDRHAEFVAATERVFDL